MVLGGVNEAASCLERLWKLTVKVTGKLSAWMHCLCTVGVAAETNMCCVLQQSKHLEQLVRLVCEW